MTTDTERVLAVIIVCVESVSFGFFQTKRSQLPDLSGISKASQCQSSRNPNRHTRADARQPTARTDRATVPHEICTPAATQRSRRMVDKHTGSLQGPDPPPPLPNPTTLHRSGPPADFVHMTGRPHHGTCGVHLLKASAIHSHRPRDRRLDEVDDALMRGRFGRLGRLRATAIPSTPLLPSLCITLGAASASVSFSDTRAHLARDQ